MKNQTLTGYPSIDKPWLKYYNEKAINARLPECTIYEYLWRNNKDYLNDIALVFMGRKITYRVLFENIEKTAKAFAALGVKAGDIVTICMLNQPETVYILYALNRIGAVTCVINVLSSEKEIVNYLLEGESSYFVALETFYDKCVNASKQAKIKKLILVPLYESFKLGKKFCHVHKALYTDNISILWSRFIQCGKDFDLRPVQYRENRCAVIGHTGGTTGDPKGVMLTDISFNGIVTQYRYKFNYNRQDTFLATIVPFAVYGLVINIHLPLVLGVTVILIPKVNPKATDKLFAKYKPNHVAGIPGYWSAIVKSKKLKNMSWLKTAAAGGAGMTLEFEQELNNCFCNRGAEICFLNGYGMSEVGSTACTQTNDCTEAGSVGIPLVKTVVIAVDPDTKTEKKYGQEGEICISTPCIMLGYIGKLYENENIMFKHTDERVYIHTGDLGYINDSGFVYVTGRIKRVYITQQKGTVSKIFPERIERIIESNPAVESCCTICITNSENVFCPVSYVVLKEANINSEESIREELVEVCKKDLPEYAQPLSFKFLSVLPLTSVGKIDYLTLEEEAKKRI